MEAYEITQIKYRLNKVATVFKGYTKHSNINYPIVTSSHKTIG